MSALLEQITADLDCFLSSDEWGQTATLSAIPYDSGYTYDAEIGYEGSGSEIIVIFEEAAAVLSPVDNETITTSPMAWAKTSDVSGLTRGAQLTIAGTTYYLMNIQPDGMGMSAMILSRKATA